MAKERTVKARGPEYLRFGTNLANLRKSRGLSQSDVASALGIVQSTYAGWETGARKVQLSAILQLSEFFNVSVDALIGVPTSAVLVTGGCSLGYSESKNVTLGEVVKKYRIEHDLSLRDFSRISGVSNGYISMLEKNEHPKTKKPIVPSIEKMKSIASAMGMSLDALLEIIGKDRSAPAPVLSDPERELLSKFRRLNVKGQQKLNERADELLDLGYVQKGDAQKMA